MKVLQIIEGFLVQSADTSCSEDKMPEFSGALLCSEVSFRNLARTESFLSVPLYLTSSSRTLMELDLSHTLMRVLQGSGQLTPSCTSSNQNLRISVSSRFADQVEAPRSTLLPMMTAPLSPSLMV